MSVQKQKAHATVSDVVSVRFDVNDPDAVAKQIAAGSDWDVVRQKGRMSVLLKCGETSFQLCLAHGTRQGVVEIGFGATPCRDASSVAAAEDGTDILGVRHSFQWNQPQSGSEEIRPRGMCVDHIAICVLKGQLDAVVNEYRRGLGLKVAHRDYAILNGADGLRSVCLVSDSGRVVMPIVEADGRENHVSTYVDDHGDGGVQHVAFRTRDILSMCSRMATVGTSFMSPPREYYNEIRNRVHGIAFDLDELERFGIVVDTDGQGHLLQTFTTPLEGERGMFLEIVQRDGVGGFSSRNASVLYDAAERHIAPQ